MKSEVAGTIGEPGFPEGSWSGNMGQFFLIPVKSASEPKALRWIESPTIGLWMLARRNFKSYSSFWGACHLQLCSMMMWYS